MAEYYLQTKDLAVGYQGKALIHDINFGICKGEIVTLIGPNGSGKSTILKSITRQLRLVGGKVFFDDTSLTNISYKELSSRMAVVLTERIRTELMTCHDIVATGRYPYTGRLGILTADFNAISDGQKQRIMLARAICQEPEIIVLDEPTSYLDIRYKLELLDILKRMAKEKGITVLMSLHEIDLAQKCADRIVCVRGEEIMAYGTPEEVFYEETIEKLYDLDNGSYNPLSGSLELKKTEGEPEVFVISSGGNGTPIYRKLQREGRPFAAGILYTNDVDYQAARVLASKIITEEPFEEISDNTYKNAENMIDQCQIVVNAGVHIGSCNHRMRNLLQYAQEKGKLKRDYL